MSFFRRILVAVDEGPLSSHATDIGAELSRSTGAELGFIHVIDTEFLENPGEVLAARDLNTASHEKARRLLHGFCERSNMPASPKEFMPVGKPAEEIVKTAREWPADLIVIGSHGRSRVQRALLGSVAEDVIRNAPCPVQVVRFPQQAGE